MRVGGFYVIGRAGQSVAWYFTREAAEACARRLNYCGGTHYRVEAGKA